MSLSADLATLPTIVKIADKSFPIDNNVQEVFQVTFENAYTVSIARGPFSYGGREGLFEVACIDDISGEFVYDRAGFSGDVLGWQSKEDVLNVAAAIAALPRERTGIELEVGPNEIEA